MVSGAAAETLPARCEVCAAQADAAWCERVGRGHCPLGKPRCAAADDATPLEAAFGGAMAAVLGRPVVFCPAHAKDAADFRRLWLGGYLLVTARWWRENRRAAELFVAPADRGNATWSRVELEFLDRARRAGLPYDALAGPLRRKASACRIMASRAGIGARA